MTPFRTAFAFALFCLAAAPAIAQTPPPPPPPPGSQTYSSQEVLSAGHRFFGGVSRELALLVERATRQWGQPNGYILGEEGSG